MSEEREYKPTPFDRHGPAAAEYLRAWGYGVMVFAISLSAFTLQGRFSLWALLGSAAAGAAAGGAGIVIGNLVGGAWTRIAVDGASTPYKEQFSCQQALVMRGEIDRALESYEAVIAEQPASADARIRAAELYVKERGNAARAAELFREVQRNESATAGEYAYATNRLVDLLAGPLSDPGRATVELRRLIERYPGSSAAAHAREALRELKRANTVERANGGTLERER